MPTETEKPADAAPAPDPAAEEKNAIDAEVAAYKHDTVPYVKALAQSAQAEFYPEVADQEPAAYLEHARLFWAFAKAYGDTKRKFDNDESDARERARKDIEERLRQEKLSAGVAQPPVQPGSAPASP